MPVVVFLSPGGSPAVEVDAPRGGRLLDLCDDHGAPVPFSCRSASCGTCRIEVIEGIDLLEPAADDEIELLGIFGDDPRHRRLACQARVHAGTGRVCVRPAD